VVYPRKNVTAKLGSTGLDARTVVGIKEDRRENSQQYRQQFLRELRFESAIVEGVSSSVKKSMERKSRISTS
jgi:hypothetical protein